ncbi:CRISPR-associated endonuclease Cas2 [Candidatus Nomurabacteria bacterium RIFOXYB1_FULL_39_16]|uniref:CRISPR-associated endonuclease Cas2 n=2 Tax=Candidatus Nomuraibacteriota TaxID=1752729 RepID=A0A1F6YSI6_9BACT|nr:MAG: CRISPR-associated endonuclease Cas2 [Candidatus Nomurabacteria bacterium RIFOXYB1_FULL_39_16]
MARYKGMKVNAFGLPVPKDDHRSRIKRKNRKRNFYHTAFSSLFNENSPKNLILMYDVAEEKKKERDWFRRQLKNFGYVMIQRSVWVGPSPLSKEFVDYVKEIGLQDHLKTFKLAKAYTGKESVFN